MDVVLGYVCCHFQSDLVDGTARILLLPQKLIPQNLIIAVSYIIYSWYHLVNSYTMIVQ